MKIQTAVLVITYALLLIICLAQRSCIARLNYELAQKCPCDSTRVDSSQKINVVDSTPLYEPEMAMGLEGGKIPQTVEPPATPKKKQVTTGSGELMFEAESGEFQPIDPLKYEYATGDDIHFLHDVQKMQYGTITIDDSLQYNRVKNRRLSYNLQLPTRIEYIRTGEYYHAPAIRLYVGFNVLGFPGDWLHAAGPSIAVQTRSGTMYEVSPMVTRTQLIYQAGLRIPLNH